MEKLFGPSKHLASNDSTDSLIRLTKRKQIGYTIRRESDRQDRFGVSEEADSPDEGPGPFADCSREADEGLASVRHEGALGRRQHILPDGGQVRARAPDGLLPSVEAHRGTRARNVVRADMKKLLVSMKRPAPSNGGVRYSAYPTGAERCQK